LVKKSKIKKTATDEKTAKSSVFSGLFFNRKKNKDKNGKNKYKKSKSPMKI